jgi:hypothetical protein
VAVGGTCLCRAVWFRRYGVVELAVTRYRWCTGYHLLSGSWASRPGILFGGLGGPDVCGRGGDREHGNPFGSNPFREKWFKMSDEERKEFIRKHSLFHAPIFDGYGVEEPEKKNESLLISADDEDDDMLADFADVLFSNLVPPYLDLDAFGIDFGDALWTLLNTIQQLEENVDDTEMVARNEAYQASCSTSR